MRNKLINLKHGERPEESDYPSRFYSEELQTQAGPKTLDPAAVQATLSEYYTAGGWDPITGVPGIAPH